jgi:mono/diheme cytochrome c family protein
MALVAAGALSALVVAAPGAQGRQGPPGPLAIDSLGPTESFDGDCAPCHGQDGAGDGPVAAELRTAPADLTTLAERNGGAFPRDRVRGFVTGTGRPVGAHGSSDMPVWGPAFRALDNSDTRARVRIDGLVAHVESLQVAENGARLFRENCATCHGASGQGNGPMATQLRTAPPDLTRFAERNGGTFPSERVRQIIDGRNVASHGDPAMPVWGEAFRRPERGGTDGAADARIEALVRFLQSIQARSA